MFKKMFGKIIFLVLLLLVAAYFIRNIVITRMIEKEATKANKAMVEIDRLNYGVFGNKLTTGRIQVADIRDTKRNLVEAEGLSVEVNLGEILEKTVVVKDVFLKGVKLGTPREKDGRVEGLTPAISVKDPYYKELMGNLKQTDLAKFSPKELVKNELERIVGGFDSTLSANYEKDRKRIGDRKEYWNKKIKNDENKEKLEELKARSENLLNEIKGTKNPFEVLGKEKELRSIYSQAEKVYKSIEGDKKDFQKDLKEFAALPEKYKEMAVLDKNQIVNLIQLDQKNIDELINRILGQELGDSIYRVTNDFNGLSQKMKSSGGSGEKPPVDVFVEKARLTMEIAGVSIEGEANNIPSDPKKSRGPVDFKINGSKGASKIDIDGFVNLLSDEQQLNFRLDNLQLSEFVKELSFGDALFNLTQKLSIKGRVPTLTGDLEILDFTTKEFTKVGDGDIADIILSEAVKNLKDIKAHYYYDRNKNQLKIDSNLSQKLSSSLQMALKSNSNLISSALQEKYGKETEVYFEQIKSDTDGFKGDIETKLEENSKEVNAILDEIKKNTGLDAGDILKKVF